MYSIVSGNVFVNLSETFVKPEIMLSLRKTEHWLQKEMPKPNTINFWTSKFLHTFHMCVRVCSCRYFLTDGYWFLEKPLSKSLCRNPCQLIVQWKEAWRLKCMNHRMIIHLWNPIQCCSNILGILNFGNFVNVIQN